MDGSGSLHGKRRGGPAFATTDILRHLVSKYKRAVSATTSVAAGPGLLHFGAWEPCLLTSDYLVECAYVFMVDGESRPHMLPNDRIDLPFVHTCLTLVEEE